jgi:hypothetical protein
MFSSPVLLGRMRLLVPGVVAPEVLRLVEALFVLLVHLVESLALALGFAVLMAFLISPVMCSSPRETALYFSGRLRVGKAYIVYF